MVLLASGIGTVCGLIGMLLSYYLDVASGATVVLTASTLFLLVLTATSVKRRVAERARRSTARLSPAEVSDLYD
jgi:ABC-type Mn2+/Zn2+ transport system permease subunit